MGVGEYNKKQMDRLQEHKIAFDQEAMWEAMQKKKKRRGAFIFFTMALVALAVVFLSYGLYNYIKPNQNDKNFQSENIILKKEQSNNYQNNNELTINNSQNTTDIKSNVDHPVMDKKTSSSDVAKPSSQLSKEVNYTSKARSVGQIQNSKESSTYANSEISLNTKGNNRPYESTVINEERKTQNKIKEFQSTLKPSNDVSENSILDISPLKSKLLSILESLAEPKMLLENLDLTASPIVDVAESSKSRLHIGAYGGIGYLFRKISLEEEEILLNDETLEEISAGLELKYQIRPNVFIRSGLEYWHGTDRRESSSFTISNLNEIEDLTEFNLTEMDQGTIVQYTYILKHSIYQSINVPILIGYNTNNSTWNAFAEAGIMYNFLNTSRGELPFEVNESYEIGGRNQISPIAGLGISYSPTSKIDFYTRLNWRAKQSITTKLSNIDQEYGSLRVQLGIRIGI